MHDLRYSHPSGWRPEDTAQGYVEVHEAKRGQILLRQTACDLNYFDIYRRSLIVMKSQLSVLCFTPL